MNVLTYDELRIIEREERTSSKLYNLGDDFIDRFQSYVVDKQRVLDKSDDNFIAAKVKESTRSELLNARLSFKNIFESRARKIFSQVFIDVRMGANADFKGLMEFEKDFYNKSRVIVCEHFNNSLKGKVKKEDASTFSLKDGNFLVRFVKDFPEFAWNDLTIGPFKSEDVANLPSDVARLLLSKDVVKEVL